MPSLPHLRLLIAPVLIAWIVLLLPLFAGLVCASVFRRHLPLWVSFGFALIAAFAGFPLSETLSYAMPFGHVHTWLLMTALVAASAATSLSIPGAWRAPAERVWTRAILVGLCGAPGLLSLAVQAHHPSMALGWALAIVASIAASTRSTPGAEAALRDSGALLLAASLGGWAVGTLPAGAAASFALAAAIGGWKPQALQVAATPLFFAAVCASNLQWYVDFVGTPLEAEIYAKLMGPLPRGVDLSGSNAIDRRSWGGGRRWIGLPFGGGASLLATADTPLSELPAAHFSLVVAEDSEIFNVSFGTDGTGVLVERLADGRFGVAGMPARSSWSSVHADLRQAFAGCKASHGGVMFDPSQPWTVEEVVSVCLSARNLISEDASCTISTQRKPGCRFMPVIGWHPVCQDRCFGRSLETWEVLSGARLIMELYEEIDGHVLCPEGNCTVVLTGAGFVDLECPDDSCKLSCEQGPARREGALWRCDPRDTSSALLASP